MRREIDRKEQEKKKAQKVDFASEGTQPGIVVGVPRINIPVAVEATNPDGRQNKKLKWDKVHGYLKIPLPSVGQDSVSTGGAHTGMLYVANAGGGYMLFAQQKRREAEEKRSSERKEGKS